MEEAFKNEEQAPAGPAQLLDYYYRLKNHLWLILGVLFLTAAVAAFFTFTMKPVFRASATVLIGEDSQLSPLTGERVSAETYVAQQLTFKTHFTAITSRPVIEEILRQLDLRPSDADLGLVDGFVKNIKANVHRLIAAFLPPPEGPTSGEARELNERVAWLREKINVAEIRDTRLMTISAEDHDPQAAMAIVNALAETYFDYDAQVRFQSSKMMMDWLSKQLYETRKKVAEAERTFMDFKERENLFSSAGKQKLSTEKIAEMNGNLVEVRTSRLEKEAVIAELKKFLQRNSGQVKSIPSFLNSPILEELYSDLLKTQVEYNRLSGIYKNKHPEMVQVVNKIEGLSGKIRQEVNRAMENADAEHAVLAAKENALENARTGYEGEAMALNQKEFEYTLLEREVDTNKELYNTLLGKVKESNILGELPETRLRLMEKASLPTEPVKPKKVFNLALGLVLGLFLGVGLAFFIEFMDQTLHNRKEVENLLQLPVLSDIPVESNGYRVKKKDAVGFGPELNILNMPFNAPFVEAHSMLAAGLGFSEIQRRRGVYLVTSSVPSEGKSTITFNLAVRLSDQGLKVVVLEADLRLPATGRVKGFSGTPGLTNILLDVFDTQITTGRLGEMSVGDINKLLELQERSGVVRYSAPAGEFAVYFHKGRIVDVDWRTRPVEGRLGALLVRGGLISREHLDIALEKQQGASQRLGQILLSLGFIDLQSLAGPVRLQMQENLNELYRLREGEYCFEEELEPFPPDAREQALLEAVGDFRQSTRPHAPFLADMVLRKAILVENTKVHYIPSGRQVSNPAALLAGPRIRALVDLCRSQFDVVLFDSPPAAGISDAAILASVCDGIILIVRAGKTPVGEAARAKEHLARSRTPIMGVVLNMLDFERDPYYGGYYHKYYKYYKTSSARQDEPQQADQA
ncbi:MAG: DUF4388 domain-containing protein [Pseudomonadota bacterium]